MDPADTAVVGPATLGNAVETLAKAATSPMEAESGLAKAATLPMEAESGLAKAVVSAQGDESLPTLEAGGEASALQAEASLGAKRAAVRAGWAREGWMPAAPLWGGVVRLARPAAAGKEAAELAAQAAAAAGKEAAELAAQAAAAAKVEAIAPSPSRRNH